MSQGSIYVSELSTSRHSFENYHFCRGNSSRRKTRLGVILEGSGTYIYLNRRLSVSAGDVVFIPENIYCYSEWKGNPHIEVLYVSGFIHSEGLAYEPQTLLCDESVKEELLRISARLETGDAMESLEAYAAFYQVLRRIYPQMVRSSLAPDKTLQSAMEYITSHWNQPFSVGEVAKHCCVSESTLYHLFQRELGLSPVRYLHSIRVNIAMEYLENTNYSISTISRMVAFGSENQFRKVFFDVVGTTPLKFRKARP